MRNALRTERERGAVLYLALFVLIPMAALTFALVRIATSFSSEHRHRIEDEHTLFLAEAGVQEAMAALVAGGTGSVGSAAAPVYFGDGLLWVEAEQVANRLIMLHSAAMYEGGRAAVDQLVSWRYASNLDTVIFSRRALDIHAGGWPAHQGGASSGRQFGRDRV